MQVILSTFKLPPRISIYPDQIYSNNQAYLVPYRLSEIHSSQSVDSCLALASPLSCFHSSGGATRDIEGINPDLKTSLFCLLWK